MSAPKKILIGSLCLFALIGTVGYFKKNRENRKERMSSAEVVNHEEVSEASSQAGTYLQPVKDSLSEQNVDQVWRLFTTGRNKLPIVETLKYHSRVSWLKGRPAWITDYASHHATSRHFIARSLNGKEDYFTQKIATGDRFNVLRNDINLQFHLVVDLSRCKMWFYYYDQDANERVLLKTYQVGLGRFDQRAQSGLLTPKGQFTLGDKVATYKPGVMGYFQGSQVEMIQVFGTRWIPFQENSDTVDGDNPQGYGMHGVPWLPEESTGDYKECDEVIGQYASDGCIRLRQADIEELYAILITKPTTVSIVADFKDAQLPGVEVEK